MITATTAAPAARALTVEDDKGVSRLLQVVLQRMGYASTQVTTGAAGLEALAAPEGFSLVLTDKNLPEVNGVEVARAARQRLPGACIIMMSGYATAASADELHGIVDAYVQKPFQIAELQEQIRLLTARRQRQTADNAAPAGGDKQLATSPRGAALLLAPGPDGARLQRVLTGLGAQVVTLKEPQAVESLPDDTLLVIDDASCSHQTYRAIWHRQAKSQAFRVALLCAREALRSSLNAVSLGASIRLFSDAPDDELQRAIAAELRGGAA